MDSVAPLSVELPTGEQFEIRALRDNLAVADIHPVMEPFEPGPSHLLMLAAALLDRAASEIRATAPLTMLPA